ncbi:MAG: methyltransferase domain-containing protein [Chloroflexales bacterium]|nr:methyltransferase domain-containing protein [Chloroflexales bacterium]
MNTQQGMLTFDAEVGRKLEGAYRTPEAQARRKAAREAVWPRPGEHGLDIGPGPGFLACELARQVGARGHITAIDVNPAMLALTRDRAHQEGVAEQVTVHEGDAAALPFLDQSFDFVVAVQVYEYVPTIAQALAEAYRVLRPGGRLAIVATDWDTLILHTDKPAVNAHINQAWDEHLAHRKLPQRVPGLLHQAGFHLTGVSIVPVINITYDPSSFGFFLINLIATFVRGREGVSGAEVDDWLADIEGQSNNGGYFFSLSQHLFQAIRPAAEHGI